MKNRVSNLLSFRHWIIILIGIALTVFSGLHLFEVSAKTEISKNSAAQNTTSSKIVYEALNGTFGSPQTRIVTANADGSAQFTIGGGGFPIFDPCWSADGTKIAYISATFDIVAVNADLTGSVIGITNSQGVVERNPAWSSTNKIAYERTNQIWVVNADGNEPDTVSRNHAADSAISRLVAERQQTRLCQRRLYLDDQRRRHK